MASLAAVELSSEDSSHQVLAVNPDDVGTFETVNSDAEIPSRDLGALFDREVTASLYSGVDANTSDAQRAVKSVRGLELT
jgi:hypothetical protein